MRRRRSNVVVLGTDEIVPAPIVISPKILAFPVTASRFEIVGPTSDLWGMTGSALKTAALGVMARAGAAPFLWVDPPAGVDPTEVETALREAGAAVGRRPKLVADNPLGEEVVSIPASMTQTIREVVEELALEVRAPLTDTDRTYLHEILDAALTGAGL